MRFFLFSKVTEICPFSLVYFTALSRRMVMRPRIAFSSPFMDIIGSMALVKPFSCTFAGAWKVWHTSSTISDRGNSTFILLFCPSSIRESITRVLVRSASRFVCPWISWSHSFSPKSISKTSVSASIMVNGVFSSCPASVIKRFCFS